MTNTQSNGGAYRETIKAKELTWYDLQVILPVFLDH